MSQYQFTISDEAVTDLIECVYESNLDHSAIPTSVKLPRCNVTWILCGN